MPIHAEWKTNRDIQPIFGHVFSCYNQKWESMITAWEANPKAPNPYEESESGK